MSLKNYKYKKLPSYDELRWLFENDPDEIEVVRQELSEQAIESSDERIRPRLRGILFRIRCVLQTSNNPLHGCILLNRMMMDSFVNMREAIILLNNCVERPLGADFPIDYDDKSPTPKSKSATILPFPKK